MTEEERRNTLAEPFGSGEIKHRKQGGMSLAYIDTPLVIRRLNNAFGIFWSFTCQDATPADSTLELVVKGTLAITIDGTLVTKEQFGSKQRIVKNATGEIVSELGDDLKSAASDALKKCATLFEVALHLYDKDAPYKSEPPSEKQIGFFKNLLKSSSLTDEEKERGEERLKGKLTKQDMTGMIEKLQTVITSRKANS
mgnify:CR=1 FL=1